MCESMIGVNEFARRMGVHPQTIRRAIKRGDCPPYVYKWNEYHFEARHVERWIADNMTVPAAFEKKIRKPAGRPKK